MEKNDVLPPPDVRDETRLGELLVRRRLATELQVASALRWQRTHSPGGEIPLGQVLVERGVLTSQQLSQVLDGFLKKPRLGEVLVRAGALTADELNHAVAVRERTEERLGDVLVKLKYVTDEQVRQALANQCHISFVDLDSMEINRALGRVINRSFARRHGIVPVASVGDVLTICFDDPTDERVMEDLARSTGRTIVAVTASRDAIGRALVRLYDEQGEGGANGAKTSGETLQLELVTQDDSESRKARYTEDHRREKTADTIVRRVLSAAVESRATDIHIETLSNHLQFRFRVDGMLNRFDLGDSQEASNHLSREIVSRLKILSKLDISERRRPQDGSFRIKVSRQSGQDDVDLRVSVVPTHYGESVVIRILDRRNAPTSLDQLNYPPELAERLRKILARPSGVFLVTGPTGSGKSTTLYAALMTAYRPQIRVLTAEDPIEYLYDEFSQSEVDEKVGNTFAAYLRAFLRHDPEVIMVGEIRDEETAEMAFRAAQTGHLLLSTLHTNTAVGCVPRLLDLKVDPDTIASTLIGALSQRLVRQVCEFCQVEYEPSPTVLRELFLATPDIKFVKGQGCKKCALTGYRGRIAIAELWMPSNDDTLLINKRASVDEMFASARSSTLSMAEDAWSNLLRHRTTVEEIVRVVPFKVITELREKIAGLQMMVQKSA